MLLILSPWHELTEIGYSIDSPFTPNYRRNLMKKYAYQTCLRMSENLRDSMQTICDTYQINESDYMRRSIAESVKNDLANAENADQKFMFVWWSDNTLSEEDIRTTRISLGHTNEKDTIDDLDGVFFCIQ